MKRVLFTSIVAFAFSILSVHAQLQVAMDGKVYIQRDTLNGNASLTVGNNQPGMLAQNGSNDKFGIRSFAYNSVAGNCVGLYSESRQSIQSNDYFSTGVWGMGGGAVDGRNYGVLASLHTGQKGAAIYATNTDDTYFKLGGNYSGYFYGPLYLEGEAYSTQGFYIHSDMRLKNNVTPLSSIESMQGSTLANLLDIEVLRYTLMSPRQKEAGAAAVPSAGQPTDVYHYGISAQALQRMYPDLVREGGDGYLNVNYIELVPLLIRSLQEMKAELDELRATILTPFADNGQDGGQENAAQLR